MSEPKLPVIVAQYDLQGHPRRTEDWDIVVLASQTSIHSFEVRGNMDSFTYVPEFDVKVTLDNLPTYRGGCHIGNIPVDYLQTMRERLGQIPIVKRDPTWDCQVWVMEAVRLIKEDGHAFPHISEAYLREELAEDMERWQQAEDTVDERLLATSTT